MELIKETGLKEKDLELLRETFVEQYATKKGWDKNKLTPEQLFEITQQSGYKSPGLLKS
jgi:hypothetical protein